MNHSCQPLTVDDLRSMASSGELEGRAFGPDEIPNEVYHAGPGVSASGLKAMVMSPKQYKLEVLYRVASAPTDSQLVGTAFHMAILEPDRFSNEVLGMDRRSKAAKDAIAAGKIVLTPKDFKNIPGMAEAVHAHKLLKDYLNNVQSIEQSIYWRDASTGLLCKCRPDLLTLDEVIVDLKKIANIMKADNAIFDYSYHVQAAHYTNGIKAAFGIDAAFNFAFVEAAPPHHILVGPIDSFDMRFGVQESAKAMARIADCLATGEWPGLPEKLTTFKMPPWAYKKERKAFESNLQPGAMA